MHVSRMRPENDIRSSRSGVAGSCNLTRKFWGPLQEQDAPQTTELSSLLLRTLFLLCLAEESGQSCVGLQRSEGSLRGPGPEVANGRQLPSMGAGNQTHSFCLAWVLGNPNPSLLLQVRSKPLTVEPYLQAASFNEQNSNQLLSCLAQN